MSQRRCYTLRCPGCQSLQRIETFLSFNADRLVHLKPQVLGGDLLQHTCGSCQLTYYPEHAWLYTEPSRGCWVVILPRSERRYYPTLERAVGEELTVQVQRMPELLASWRQIRPRLVFGSPFLQELLWLEREGLSPVVSEALKLLVYQRRLAEVMGQGPAELCLEAREPEGWRLGLYGFVDSRRRGTLRVPSAWWEDAQGLEAWQRREQPLLFSAPYVSVSRYLYPGQHRPQSGAG